MTFSYIIFMLLISVIVIIEATYMGLPFSLGASTKGKAIPRDSQANYSESLIGIHIIQYIVIGLWIFMLCIILLTIYMYYYKRNIQKKLKKQIAIKYNVEAKCNVAAD